VFDRWYFDLPLALVYESLSKLDKDGYWMQKYWCTSLHIEQCWVRWC
jgi:hypothetical protein